MAVGPGRIYCMYLSFAGAIFFVFIAICCFIEMEALKLPKFNVDTLISRLIEILPEGPRYYDVEETSDKDEIFQIKEIIREKLLRTLRDEVPHSIAIFMDHIEWEEDPIEIIQEDRGIAFDPQLTDVFLANQDKLREIMKAYLKDK